MPKYALKAAVADFDQLAARASYLVERELPVRIELHTFGLRDIGDTQGRDHAHANVRRLTDAFPVESLVVHVPPQSVSLVTRAHFDVEQCHRSISFAQEIKANAVVMHRYYGLVFRDAPARIADREEAVIGFEAIMRELAAFAGTMPLLVENVGHYSLLPRDGTQYMTGPLDHFFPWEIERFRAFVAREGLSNVAPFVDVAHATLSSNLFNRRRGQPQLTRDDPRFAWITPDDLERAAWLEPFAFVDDAMPYLHISDAVRLDEKACHDPDLSERALTQALVSEGLEIGTGNLPFATLPSRFRSDGVLVLEVDPAAGEAHVANGAQLRSLDSLMAIYGAA
jgi:hypothetical protein